MPEKLLTKKGFEEATKEYKKANTQVKLYEKIVEKLKPSIKAFIKAKGGKNEKGSFDLATPDAQCELRKSMKNKSQSEMVAVLKAHKVKGCIKKIEVVDEEALETAVLNGEVSKDVLAEMQFPVFSLYVK